VFDEKALDVMSRLLAAAPVTLFALGVLLAVAGTTLVKLRVVLRGPSACTLTHCL
jgi:hypothetical protein